MSSSFTANTNSSISSNHMCLTIKELTVWINFVLSSRVITLLLYIIALKYLMILQFCLLRLNESNKCVSFYTCTLIPQPSTCFFSSFYHPSTPYPYRGVTYIINTHIHTHKCILNVNGKFPIYYLESCLALMYTSITCKPTFESG